MSLATKAMNEIESKRTTDWDVVYSIIDKIHGSALDQQDFKNSDHDYGCRFNFNDGSALEFVKYNAMRAN